MPGKTKISILGCGWYGSALAKGLIADGMQVKGSTTSTAKMDNLAALGIRPYVVNFSPGEEIYDADFFDCDILWISIPPKSRSGEGDIFLQKVKGIVHAIKRFAIQQVIFVSSTGVYADNNRHVNEETDPQPNTEAGRILFEAEKLFRAEDGFKTTIIRFAGLIGPGRDPGRFFAGKKEIPNGDAPVNLIHLDDCIGISKTILAKQAFGYLFNGCSPKHPAKADFYTQAALDSGFEKPEFIRELKEWKVVESINVGPVLAYQYQVLI
ncbi:nucleoside-diphosphate-sugar epimerase [Mucilaginibacter sp. SG538B]|uniref:SDR family oxidoreductase n=1 Tax=Mucilaginibacter sp. SG538B TaxID=2587021 RepID=UPI00159E3A80|nr:SDR family oxidoreductase [Mucilaginibacter sp. SG538B]NVM62094.1 nucleoside-diphosphate-sugar epimerase [Mucilaginibacter sp. SG538B]